MMTDKYRMSFTAGTLLQQESVNIAEIYLKTVSWDVAREDVLSKNILQAKTESTAKRICLELCARLKYLHEDELELLVEGDHQEQAYLLWLAVCRCYRFIYEFSTEVIREHFLTLKYDLRHEDYDAFFNAKIEWHEELEKITDSTNYKLRQVLFKMLHEAELLNANDSIIPAMLSSRLIDVICKHSAQDLRIYPVMDTQLQGCI